MTLIVNPFLYPAIHSENELAFERARKKGKWVVETHKGYYYFNTKKEAMDFAKRYAKKYKK